MIFTYWFFFTISIIPIKVSNISIRIKSKIFEKYNSSSVKKSQARKNCSQKRVQNFQDFFYNENLL